MAQVKLTPLELNYITELIKDTGGGKFVSDIMEEVPSLKIKDGILSFANKHKDKFNKFIDDLWIAEKAPSGPGAHTIPPRMRSGNIITQALKYNPQIGAIVNTATDDVVSQAGLKAWAADNPMPVKVGTVKPGIIKKVLSKIPGPIGVGAMAYGVKNMLDEGASVGEALSMPLMLNSRVSGMEEKAEEITGLEGGQQQDDLIEEYAMDYKGYAQGGLASLTTSLNQGRRGSGVELIKNSI